MRAAASVAAMAVAGMFLSTALAQNSESAGGAASTLAQWRQGVWLLQDGSFAIYTDSHYFVLLAEGGDGDNANIYCGASQIRFHDQGLARKQILRVRKVPSGEFSFFKDNVLTEDHGERLMEIDPSQFSPGNCNIKDGIIYDSITEMGNDYILLTSCNGDREKIFSNGVAVYLPAGGGESHQYRIEEFQK
ncbi:MAG TPA: hypothetical protein VF398_02875 [bacterium]|jgi:hypothetical protein